LIQTYPGLRIAASGARTPMPCVLGLDIGTTSTIGILIRPPDETLALSSRPVTLRSDYVGWAEEDPEQWWANVGEIVRELLRTSGISPADIGAVGVAGMLPAVVLLDSSGRLLRSSIQQSDARCGVEVDELRAEIDENAFLAKAGNGVNQQLVAAKLRWIERHEPEVFARIATVFGSYDYVNWRLTAERAIEQNWALEAGFVDLKTHAVDDGLVALAHIPRAALPRKVASHEILGVVSNQGAAESGLKAGTPVIGGAADHIASALGAGVVSAGDVLLKFGGSVDILTATDHARPDPRLFLDYHLKPGLFVPNGCMSTGGSALNWFARQFASGEAQAADKASPVDPSMAGPARRGAPSRQRFARHHALFSWREDADPRRQRPRDLRRAHALARRRPPLAGIARGLRLRHRASYRGHG
jgi:xylulokinase